jgi:hypothetical protein
MIGRERPKITLYNIIIIIEITLFLDAPFQSYFKLITLASKESHIIAVCTKKGPENAKNLKNLNFSYSIFRIFSFNRK